jgi:endo-1,3(4)-beta-glucanase
MLPLSPASIVTRRPAFVREEWDTYFNNSRADGVQGGWRGILYANLALIDPQRAWRFFSDSNFDNAWLDGGASRAWYLAWAAGLGGAC